MLLPSAFNPNHDEPTHQFRAPLGNLFSPPNSPTLQSTPSSTLSSIFTTCRTLQSMLTAPNQLPPSPLSSPPLLHAPIPTPKLRLRTKSRKLAGTHTSKPVPRMKMRIPLRPVSPSPRASNKRRRSISDEGREESVDSDSVRAEDGITSDEEGMMLDAPSTPKRSRIAPETIPFGLARSDYHTLHLTSMPATSAARRSAPPATHRSKRNLFHSGSSRTISATTQSMPFMSSPIPFKFNFSNPATPSGSASNGGARTPSAHTPSIASQQGVSPFLNNVDTALANDSDNASEAPDSADESQTWTTEDDKMLVEVVLEKLKLTKSEWDECARSLGKGRGDVNKRWKSLMSNGEIGLKKGNHQRRSELFSTWK